MQNMKDDLTTMLFPIICSSKQFFIWIDWSGNIFIGRINWLSRICYASTVNNLHVTSVLHWEILLNENFQLLVILDRNFLSFYNVECLEDQTNEMLTARILPTLCHNVSVFLCPLPRVVYQKGICHSNNGNSTANGNVELNFCFPLIGGTILRSLVLNVVVLDSIKFICATFSEQSIEPITPGSLEKLFSNSNCKWIHSKAEKVAVSQASRLFFFG